MECPDDWRETIEKDLHRQFPDHEMFQTKGNGQQDLFRVLKAWVLYNPRVGYCQGQAPVAALLLMNLTGQFFRYKSEIIRLINLNLVSLYSLNSELSISANFVF